MQDAATNSVISVGMDWELAEQILSSHGAKEVEGRAPKGLVFYRLGGGSVLSLTPDQPVSTQKSKAVGGMMLCREADDWVQSWSFSLGIRQIDIIGPESRRLLDAPLSHGRGSNTGKE